MISTEQKFLLNRMNSVASKTQLGTLIDAAMSVRKFTYDVAVDGGAVGAHVLAALEDKLPSGAIVMNVVVDIVTAFTSTGGTGTVALMAQGAGDLLAAVDADTLSARVQGIPNSAVANMIKLTADRSVTATVAVNPMLTGKADVYVFYVK